MIHKTSHKKIKLLKSRFLVFGLLLLLSLVILPKESLAAESESLQTMISTENFVASLFDTFDYSPYIYGAIPDNADDKGFAEMPEHARNIILAKSNMGTKYDKSKLPKVRNSRGEETLSEMVIYEYDVMNVGPKVPKADVVQGETVDFELTLPGRFNSLKLKGLKYDVNKSIKMEDLNSQDVSLPGKKNMKIYAMDLSGLNFSYGNYYDVAEGRELWKCRDWNFENQTCYGTWQKIMNIVPGMEYSFPVSAVDPAYVEVFDINSSIDVDVAALDNETIVLTWVDGATNNYVSFEIWNTGGIKIVDEVNVDTTGDTGSSVSVASVNNTHFVIGWIDGPADDLVQAGYTVGGSSYIASAALDVGAGTIVDVDVCELGNRYSVISAGDDDADADFWIRNNANGASLVAETAVDTTMTPSANNQNLVSCSLVNSSGLWAYAFFDDADNDASVFLRNASGSAVGAVLDIDANVGEIGQVAVAGLRNNRYAYVFYDSNVSSVYMTVRGYSAGHTTILANTVIDANAGTESRVDVAEVEFSGQSYFVTAWYDQSDTTIKAGIYNGSGAQVTAPFTVTSTPSTSFPIVSVTGTYSSLGFGLCNGTFAIAYANSSENTVFETYWYNGTRWNGICGSADIDAPIISIITPANNTLNDTDTSITFLYNITDESSYVNCSLYIDGEVNQTNNLVSRGVTENFTISFDNGDYTWEINCSDIFGNSNSSGIYNLNVSVYFYANNAQDIDIDSLGERTLVMSWVSGDANNYISFEVWDTNGTRLVNQVDVDTTGDTGSAVAVASVNITNFVIGWIDGPLDDLVQRGYTIFGSSYIANTVLDTGAGTIADVDVCELGGRYGVISAGNDDADADFWIRNNANGASLVAETAVDGTITPEANNQNLVSCSLVNSSGLWAYAFFDDADNDASVFLRNASGGAVGVQLDIDTEVGETGQVAVAGLRDNRYAYVFYDSNVSSVYMTVRGYSGGHTTILANTVIDANAGNESRVDVAEVEFSGQSYFAAAWYDQSDTTIKAAIYDNSGSEITAPFNVSTEPTANIPIVSLTGTHSNLGFGLCNGTFAIAYTNSSGNAVFRTYWINGTRSNGECIEFAPPNITIISPLNNTLNKSTSNITFYYNVSDQSTVSNCTIYINSSLILNNYAVIKNTVLTFNVTLLNGNYSWKIGCIDEWENEINTSLYNLNVSWYTPTIQDITSETLITLNAGATKRVDCNTTIYEGNGYADINVVNATLFMSNMTANSPADNNTVYKNASCVNISSFGNMSNYTCSFYVYYYANNGSWNCSVNAYDDDYWSANNMTNTSVDTLYALNTSATFIDYGNVFPGSNSSDRIMNITNFGNMPLNITVHGYGGDDPVAGNGYALSCLSGENITADNQRYAIRSGRTFAQKTQLTSAPIDLNLTVQKQTVPGLQRTNSSYWQMYVPPMPSVTQCNGTIVFTATAP